MAPRYILMTFDFMAFFVFCRCIFSSYFCLASGVMRKTLA